jgi:predicted nucleic acid-binding protein
MLSFDSNILVYAADSLAGERHLQASRLLESAIEVKAGLTEQCILEFLNVSAVKARPSVSTAVSIARELAVNFRILLPSASIVEDVLLLLGKHRLNIWDARILAVCAAHGCEYLLSEDMQDGADYGGVTVLNPFKPVNQALLERLLQT